MQSGSSSGKATKPPSGSARRLYSTSPPCQSTAHSMWTRGGGGVNFWHCGHGQQGQRSTALHRGQGHPAPAAAAAQPVAWPGTQPSRGPAPCERQQLLPSKPAPHSHSSIPAIGTVAWAGGRPEESMQRARAPARTPHLPLGQHGPKADGELGDVDVLCARRQEVAQLVHRHGEGQHTQRLRHRLRPAQVEVAACVRRGSGPGGA